MKVGLWGFIHRVCTCTHICMIYVLLYVKSYETDTLQKIKFLVTKKYLKPHMEILFWKKETKVVKNLRFIPFI